MGKAKARKTREWVIGVEYTVRGSVTVEAATEREAREAAHDEMTCPPTCEVIDWETLRAREAE